MLKVNENQLIIPNVQLDDGRVWRCIVANEYGFDSLDFELEILGMILVHCSKRICLSTLTFSPA